METSLPNPIQELDAKSAKRIESSKNIMVSLTKSKGKIEVKQKGHKAGRMKVTLKFNKDEAEGFMNFCKLVKPEQMDEDSFVKFLFYKGVQSLQQDFAAAMDNYKEKNPEEFAKLKAELESVDQPTSEGSVTIADDKQ